MIISCSNGFSKFAFLSKSYSWKKNQIGLKLSFKTNWSVWNLNVAAKTQGWRDIHGFLSRKWYTYNAIFQGFKTEKLKPDKNKVFATNVHVCFDFLVTKKEEKFKQGKIMSGKVCQTFLYSILTLVDLSYYNVGSEIVHV